MKVFVTAVKIFCYGVVVLFSHGHIFGLTFKNNFNLHCLFFCGAGILLSYSKVGYCISDYRLTRYLGKISLPIFIYHKMLRHTWVEYVGSESFSATYNAYMVSACIIVSVALMYITDFFADRIKNYCTHKE